MQLWTSWYHESFCFDVNRVGCGLTIITCTLMDPNIPGVLGFQVDNASGHRPDWGGWSNWGTWSSCSQPCGQGLSARSRQCRVSHRWARFVPAESGSLSDILFVMPNLPSQCAFNLKWWDWNVNTSLSYSLQLWLHSMRTVIGTFHLE